MIAQMNFMKTLLPLLIASISLTACGGSDTSTAKTPPAVAAAKPAAVVDPLKRGAKVFVKCRACHTLEENGRHKVGPNLWDFYGKKAASKEGFAYSKAMQAADIIWDETTLDGYLKRPSAYMPGNRMTFIGLKKQTDRDAVQAFLRDKTTP